MFTPFHIRPLIEDGEIRNFIFDWEKNTLLGLHTTESDKESVSQGKDWIESIQGEEWWGLVQHMYNKIHNIEDNTGNGYKEVDGFLATLTKDIGNSIGRGDFEGAVQAGMVAVEALGNAWTTKQAVQGMVEQLEVMQNVGKKK